MVTWVTIKVNVPSDALNLVRETSGDGHPPSRVLAHQVSRSQKELPAPETAGIAEKVCQLPPPISNCQNKEERFVDTWSAGATARLTKPSSATTALEKEFTVAETGGQLEQRE